MTIDENGYLWVAVFDGSKVIQIDPRTGKKLRQLDFPTKNITSVAFGGEDLDVMYVTSAEHFLSETELKEQVSAGGLFEVRGLGVKGLDVGMNYGGAV
jgi:sugar lactone lactonase YvrE